VIHVNFILIKTKKCEKERQHQRARAPSQEILKNRRTKDEHKDWKPLNLEIMRRFTLFVSSSDYDKRRHYGI